MRAFPVHACSDVTGFGLLGHASEMAMGSGVTLVLDSDRAAAAAGRRGDWPKEAFLTGGCKRNRAYLADKVAIDPSVPAGLGEVAFDPQTSGGLLIALPEKKAPALVAELRAAGVKAAAIVGHVTSRKGAHVRLV